MRAFVRLVIQHLILLGLLIFICIGLVFRQQIFGVSPVPAPQPRAAGSLAPRIAQPTEAPPAGGIAAGHPAPLSEEPAAPGVSAAATELASSAVPSTAPADGPAPAEASSAAAPVSGAIPGHPSQVPQFLSGEPVSQ